MGLRWIAGRAVIGSTFGHRTIHRERLIHPLDSSAWSIRGSVHPNAAPPTCIWTLMHTSWALKLGNFQLFFLLDEYNYDGRSLDGCTQLAFYENRN